MTLALAAVLAVAPALVLNGCGHQDRLDPGSPEPPDSLPTISWGSLEEEHPPVLWGYRPTTLDGWSRNDILLGMEAGVIIRKTGEQYRRLDLPLEKYVIHLICNPDGSAWCLDSRGSIWRLEGDTWNLEKQLPEDENYLGLQVDGQDRLWVYGHNGSLWRGTAGDWFRFDLSDTLDIDDGWVDPDGTVFLITDHLDVVRVEGESWEVTSLAESEVVYSRKMIEGDGTGRLAVASAGQDHFWLYDGLDWTREESDQDLFFSLADVFWLDGELYGVLYHQGLIVHWDGEIWTEEPEIPGLDFGGYCISSPMGEGRLIGLEGGLAVEFYPGPPLLVSRKLGDIQALAQIDGTLHFGFESGEYMRQEEGFWRFLPRALPPGERMMANGLLIDQAGVLVVVGTQSIVRVVEGAEPELLLEVSYPEVFPQDDGTALVENNLEVYEVVGGAVNWLETIPYTPNLESIVRARDGRLCLLNNWRLVLMENGAEETWLTLADWRPLGLMLDPQLGMVVYGNDKVLLESGADFLDISPWVSGGLTWNRLVLDDICLDGLGGWLGTNSSGANLLRFDGEAWSKLDFSFPMVANILSRGFRVVPAGDGSFLVYNDLMLQRLIPEGGMP